MKKQLFSFSCAARGLWNALCEEGHLRFELVAAAAVIFFAAIGGLDSARIALLCVLIACVIACELLNTAIERVCDLITGDFHPLIKFAKDAAAAAVLVLSAASVAVAVLFFCNADFVFSALGFFSSAPCALIIPALFAAASVVFVAVPPRKFKKKTSRESRKK